VKVRQTYGDWININDFTFHFDLDQLSTAVKKANSWNQNPSVLIDLIPVSTGANRISNLGIYK